MHLNMFIVECLYITDIIDTLESPVIVPHSLIGFIARHWFTKYGTKSHVIVNCFLQQVLCDLGSN